MFFLVNRHLPSRREIIIKQELSSDIIARLDELEDGGGVQCKVNSFDIKIMGVGKVLLNETSTLYLSCQI